MTKNQLIKNIHTAFKNVKLEDGIGIWEAQGLDNRLSKEGCEQLREKDEKKNDWFEGFFPKSVNPIYSWLFVMKSQTINRVGKRKGFLLNCGAHHELLIRQIKKR